MKLLLRIVTIIMIVSFYSCNYSREVKEGSVEIFDFHKNFMFEIGFSGIISEKKICENCENNKYTIKIILIQLKRKPEFSETHYPPYYFFENDSTLNISVDVNLFKEVEILDTVIKNSKTFTFNVNQVEIQYLNNKKQEWLPQLGNI